MKITKISARAVSFGVTSLLCLMGCQNPGNEDATDQNPQIRAENLFQKSPKKANEKVLANYLAQLASIHNDPAVLKKVAAKLNTSGLEKASKSQIIAASITTPPQVINYKDSIAKLFDPDSQPCVLPEKIIRKLKKFKENKQYWVPKELAATLNQMPDKAINLQGKGLSILLHTVKTTRANNTTNSYIIVGAPTFNSLDLDSWIFKTTNNFGYTLDCSGLLNATIEGTATVPGSDITTTASSAIKDKKTLFVGAGVVISPLYAAYFGDASGVKLNKTDRIAILSSIINMPGITDTDSIELVMSYQVIWTANNGESGFNGKGDFSAKGGIGVGFAQVGGSANFSGSVSRSTTFGSFNTYYTGEQVLNAPEHVTGAGIKALIKQLSGQ